MSNWMASAVVSWFAAMAALAIVNLTGLGSEHLPIHELPLALSATAALQLLMCGVLYEPLARLLVRMDAKDMVPFVLALSSFLPLLWFVAMFGGTPQDVFSSEGAFFLAFFIVGGGVFGFMRARWLANNVARPH